LIIDSLCVLFPFTEHKDYQWSKGNRTQRLSMIKRKQNKKTINDQKETEHKDYQLSKGNRTPRLTQRVWLVEQEAYIRLCHTPVFIPVFNRVQVNQALVSSVVLC
jgi:hypothetical protein